MKKRLVVLTGAGISAESGIPTFRDEGGLWAGYDVMKVASPEGWRENPELVLDFYNQRRKNAVSVEPNDAHKILAELESEFYVEVITQNVDNLHERAGSTNVLHLHGELFKSRSTLNPNLIYDVLGEELNLGDICELGSQLRPHIVWFGEAVPMMEDAIEVAAAADIFLVVGTSMQVYPAASLIAFVDPGAPKFIIDPAIPDLTSIPNLTTLETTATKGMRQLKTELQALI